MINDYLSGYFKDRLEGKEPPAVLHNLEDDVYIPFLVIVLLWPFTFIYLICLWSYAVISKSTNIVKKSHKLKTFLIDLEKKGEVRRKKEMDLDYQAEKYLLDKK